MRRNWKYWIKLLLISLVWGLFLYIFGYIWLYIRVETIPRQGKLCCKTPRDFGLEYQVVHITTQNDLELSGWYVPSLNGAAVILLHGDGGNRMAMLPYAAMLAKHGYGMLLYDQRACGESQGGQRSYGWLDVDDLLQAVEFVQAQPGVDPGRVGVLGASLGGQIAIRAAAQSQQIHAVVSDGTGTAVAGDIPPAETPKEWLYRSLGSLTDLVQWLQIGVKPPRGVMASIPNISPRPILLIATGQSERFPGWELRYGRALYAAASGPKTLWEIPEAHHCGGLAARPEEYEERVSSFFDTALLK